ncbi:hypothetical protein M918_04695 [Clostridium sp. BL8]|nr:hypothetical protein M918_04695 [Clostridium sp. BL8]
MPNVDSIESIKSTIKISYICYIVVCPIVGQEVVVINAIKDDIRYL